MKIVKNNFKMLRLAGKEGKLVLSFKMIRSCVGAIKTVLMKIVVPASIINALADGDLLILLLSVSAFLCLELIDIWVLNHIENTLIKSAEVKMSDDIILSLYRHSSEIDMKNFDDKNYYDKNIVALNNIPGAILTSINVLTTVIGGILAIMLNIGCVLNISRISIFYIALTVVFSVMLRFYMTRWLLKLKEEQAPLNRKIDYNFEFRSNFRYAKAVKVEKIKKLHDDAFADASDERVKIIDKIIPKLLAFFLADDFLNGMLIKVLFLMALSYVALVLKNMSAVDVIVVYSATVNISDVFKSIVQTMVSLDTVSVYAGVYDDFVMKKSELADGEKKINEINKIEFKNVSFSYNGNNNILKDVCFKVTKGMKVALVGRNGSGKTTLLKLLLRFYDTDTGKILINDTDIKEFKAKDYRQLFSVLFQDVRLINATVSENVTYGREEISDKVNKEIEIVGLKEKIDEFPDGVKTHLGHELFEDGRNLSGGQSQKLLLARALYKESSVILLDEPTAHIDIKSENEFYGTIYEKLCDKTVFYITHRLISTQNADLILVFDEKGISEIGSHDELMNKEGLYKKMYLLQTQA